ncbi:stage II sporulation protein R [Sporosarcina sp. PTS2304]|uniref:stage II sporulation protein R n=1 Tax=Sporosarcina sp. PTS2304 TaxID=2283194 RepID=UPI000E0DD492|nr:stage II sporulation protein R [Sporosarcina sp. PTS2304]AXI01126.1 stage II sporulation protein R [Sporosarcina sp. PTS2304]
MLQDYPITQQPAKISKLVAFIEFVLVLLAIQSVLLLFSQEVPTSEAAQFRILANSNTAADQQMKLQVQTAIAPLLEQALNQTPTKQINEQLLVLKPQIIERARQQANGLPITFEHSAALIPPKRIGFAIQQQGVYDAYILKIGRGKGDNWWCALFPNVCFPEEATVAETEEEPVTFFIWEWIKSWFS